MSSSDELDWWSSDLDFAKAKALGPQEIAAAYDQDVLDLAAAVHSRKLKPKELPFAQRLAAATLTRPFGAAIGLHQLVEDTFGLPWQFVHVPTGL